MKKTLLIENKRRWWEGSKKRVARMLLLLMLLMILLSSHCLIQRLWNVENFENFLFASLLVADRFFQRQNVWTFSPLPRFIGQHCEEFTSLGVESYDLVYSATKIKKSRARGGSWGLKVVKGMKILLFIN